MNKAAGTRPNWEIPPLIPAATFLEHRYMPLRVRTFLDTLAAQFKAAGLLREVAIEGKLISRSYTDKEGTKKFITEVEVNELLMLGSKATA